MSMCRSASKENKMANINHFIQIHVLFILIMFVFVHTDVLAGPLSDPTEMATASRLSRIISLKPNITQILMSLGNADQIVGMTRFCPIPNVTAQVVADYNTIDLEKIVRLKPDLVLGSTENSQKKQYDTLEQAGIPVALFDFGTFDQMVASLKSIAGLLHKEVVAYTLVEKMNGQLLQARQMLGARSGTFIAIIQRQPLMVISGKTYVSTLFEQTGLQNVFGQNQIAYPVMDEEEVVREFVDHTFDLSHSAQNESETFLNKKVIALRTEDFLASPQSVENLLRVLATINPGLQNMAAK